MWHHLLNQTWPASWHVQRANLRNGVGKEIQQGAQPARLAKRFAVRHLVCSSVAGADLKTIIETEIKALDVPHTILRPVSFFENLLQPAVKRRLLKGKLVLEPCRQSHLL